MIEYTVRVDVDGTETRWFLKQPDGTLKLHRENGPAIEWPDVTKEWFQNGQRHRDDGPAIEDADGDKYWYLHGQCHREDGPAIELADGTKYWYLNNLEYSEADFNAEMVKRSAPSCNGKFVEVDGKKYKLVEVTGT